MPAQPNISPELQLFCSSSKAFVRSSPIPLGSTYKPARNMQLIPSPESHGLRSNSAAFARSLFTYFPSAYNLESELHDLNSSPSHAVCHNSTTLVTLRSNPSPSK